MTSKKALSFYKNSHAMVVEGYEDCIVGYDGEGDRLVYSKECMVEQLCVTQQFSEIQAIEYLEFNLWYAYVGYHTPIFIFIEHEIIDEIKEK